MEKRNIVSEISQAEISAYNRPVNFITHHEVYKPGSLSTLVHLISNTSFKNSSTNLNDICVKGPNTLADIFNNLLKFRSYQVGLVFDITKAYNSIKTGIVERHLCWLWFRKSPDEDWRMYGFNCVQFRLYSFMALFSKCFKINLSFDLSGRSGTWSRMGRR